MVNAVNAAWSDTGSIIYSRTGYISDIQIPQVIELKLHITHAIKWTIMTGQLILNYNYALTEIFREKKLAGCWIQPLKLLILVIWSQQTLLVDTASFCLARLGPNWPPLLWGTCVIWFGATLYPQRACAYSWVASQSCLGNKRLPNSLTLFF